MIQAKKLPPTDADSSTPDLSAAAGMVKLGVTKTASTKKVHTDTIAATLTTGLLTKASAGLSGGKFSTLVDCAYKKAHAPLLHGWAGQQQLALVCVV